MRRYTTAESKNLESVPILSYDFAAGIRLAATSAAAASVPIVETRAVLITSTTPVFLSTAGPAADDDGSLYLAAGLPLHMILRAGESLSVLAVDAAASVFVVPVS